MKTALIYTGVVLALTGCLSANEDPPKLNKHLDQAGLVFLEDNLTWGDNGPEQSASITAQFFKTQDSHKALNVGSVYGVQDGKTKRGCEPVFIPAGTSSSSKPALLSVGTAYIAPAYGSMKTELAKDERNFYSTKLPGGFAPGIYIFGASGDGTGAFSSLFSMPEEIRGLKAYGNGADTGVIIEKSRDLSLEWDMATAGDDYNGVEVQIITQTAEGIRAVICDSLEKSIPTSGSHRTWNIASSELGSLYLTQSAMVAFIRMNQAGDEPKNGPRLMMVGSRAHIIAAWVAE